MWKNAKPQGGKVKFALFFFRVDCHKFNLIDRDDFRDFAELCFKEFGDRVKSWSTFNEPWSFSTGGYDSTTFIGCPAGDSSTEPYLVAHHIILSHAAAAKLYREKYKPSQKGQIGIVLVTNWMKGKLSLYPPWFTLFLHNPPMVSKAIHNPLMVWIKVSK
ncbi:unnamed protein product [Coffea canephora]|uniref:Beta-glucosidase n=1 Tax=Coffea canephora TaxID=49390 RepID=A0A068UT53_COFCA|nr:unnamed protein product [Coffea canephora]